MEEIEREIRQAANEALEQLEIADTTLSDVVQHCASYDFDLNKFSVQYRETSGKYFRVVVHVIEVMKEYDNHSVEAFRRKIIQLLQERDPNDYMAN